MALNIKSQKVEQLAAEVASLTGESKTEAIRKALEERKERLSYRVTKRDRQADIKRFLETEIWPRVPRALLGRKLSKREEERILGFGDQGV